jgi:uncharacterized protein (DUF58 family)
MIFDELTLRKLTRLTLVASRVRAGMIKGERRSIRRGASVEFADYRSYTPGDDLRRLDWNVYARLDRPFLRLFEEEEDLAAHILIDASRSMDWGEGERHKFSYAIRLAAALGAIALASGDQIRAAAIAGGKVAQIFGPARGQAQTLRLFTFLESQRPGGTTDLNRGLRDYAFAGVRPGPAFLISDLFSPAGFQEGLAQLRGRGFEVAVLHLLSPDESDPPLAGDLRLVDMETGISQEVSIDSGLRDLYRERIQDWLGGIRAECLQRDIRYLSINTGVPWDKIVLQEMRRAYLLR